MEPFFHVGIVVQDIETAMDELGALLGISWQTPHTSQYGEWTIEVAYSIEGPPFLELVQGGTDGPWNSVDGARLDHIGYWSDDVELDSQRLADLGAPFEVGGVSFGKSGWCYHRTTSGIRLEVVKRKEPVET